MRIEKARLKMHSNAMAGTGYCVEKVENDTILIRFSNGGPYTITKEGVLDLPDGTSGEHSFTVGTNYIKLRKIK